MTHTRTVTLEIPVPQLTLEHALWALVAVAIAADAITTQVGLQAGLVESNPAARATLEYGTLGFVAMKAGAVGVGLVCRRFLLERRYGRGVLVVPVCLAVPWLLAAAWNAVLLSEVLA